MGNNTRPENMERIVTNELADAFIAEQVAEIQAQVGGKKVLLALSGGFFCCCSASDQGDWKAVGLCTCKSRLAEEG